MTIDEVQAAILADPTLKQMAIDGRDGDIARAMTTPNTATPITISGLLGSLSAETAAKLAVNPNVTDLRDKVLAGDIEGVGLWIGFLAAGGVVSVAEAQQVQAALTAAVDNSVTVTVDQVNKALKSLRTEGKVGLNNWLGG